MTDARRRALVVFALALAAMSVGLPVAAADATSRHFTTSDGVRLHYLEAGEGPCIVFIPGWTMPAWIFGPQLAHFAARYRVVVLDPRSQGESQVATGVHHPDRRALDIVELLDHLRVDRAALAGWSLAVLELLALVKQHGDARVAALVLIDNSIGEDPPPDSRYDFIGALRKDRAGTTRSFVRSMYRQAQADAYYERLAAASLRVPLKAAIELLSYPYPRTYWREGVYATTRPVLYVVTPRWAAQGANLAKKHPNARVEVFRDAGHALFVDEATRFNAMLDAFLAVNGFSGR